MVYLDVLCGPTNVAIKMPVLFETDLGSPELFRFCPVGV
jgi:hypothetical protein